MASYTSQTISGNYNSSPPAEDESQVAANQITWAKLKTKLHDHIKALLDAIQSQAAAAVATINAVVVNQKYNYIFPTAPAAAVAGTLWFDTSVAPDANLRLYDGTDWIYLAVMDDADTIYSRIWVKINSITQAMFVPAVVDSIKLKTALDVQSASGVSGWGGSGAQRASFWPMLYASVAGTKLTGHPVAGNSSQPRIGFYHATTPYNLILRSRYVATS